MALQCIAEACERRTSLAVAILCQACRGHKCELGEAVRPLPLGTLALTSLPSHPKRAPGRGIESISKTWCGVKSAIAGNNQCNTGRNGFPRGRQRALQWGWNQGSSRGEDGGVATDGCEAHLFLVGGRQGVGAELHIGLVCQKLLQGVVVLEQQHRAAPLVLGLHGVEDAPQPLHLLQAAGPTPGSEGEQAGDVGARRLKGCGRLPTDHLPAM